MVDWTPLLVFQVLGLFILASIAEIGGGYLVWETMRNAKPWWYAVLGGISLVVYGFIPTLQPLDSFGRLYAIYGGIFVTMSFAWVMIFEKFRMDTGDIVGTIITLAGVFVILFWPRNDQHDP